MQRFSRQIKVGEELLYECKIVRCASRGERVVVFEKTFNQFFEASSGDVTAICPYESNRPQILDFRL